MIKVFEPKITFSDKVNIIKTLNKNFISGTSEEVLKFEEAFSSKFDRKYGVAVSSGSAALDLAFQNVNLQDGDEVIIPSFTIISCLSAVLRAGGKPVFCDVDKDSWNMTLSDVKKVFTEKTKAILMVHTYGLTAEADEIFSFCNENNIVIIEDAAEAHGQKYKNKFCGTYGLISTFSFYANKHITTGEGGMLLTDEKIVYDRLLKMRNLDFDNKKRFFHNNMYWNYRISSLQASLGNSQIKNLENVISRKIQQANYYIEKLQPLEDIIQLPITADTNSNNHFWVFGIVLKKEGIRDQVIESLLNEKIETRPFFWPLHLQPIIRNIKQDLPISEKIGRNGLYLPIGSHINKKMQQIIVNKLTKVLKTI